jgi:hypothetical protein
MTEIRKAIFGPTPQIIDGLRNEFFNTSVKKKKISVSVFSFNFIAPVG